jgi:predicted transcriptional regulator
MAFKASKMIGFLKAPASPPRPAARAFLLGTLELELMHLLWQRGESNVRDVTLSLDRPLAYTTVMTTLDRLFKKGLLRRHKPERAFLYSPAISLSDWERHRAENLLASFLEGPLPSRDLLLSCLLDAVGGHDASLLDDLEKRIRAKRKELFSRSQP